MTGHTVEDQRCYFLTIVPCDRGYETEENCMRRQGAWILPAAPSLGGVSPFGRWR